jgi:hypothetical protein
MKNVFFSVLLVSVLFISACNPPPVSNGEIGTTTPSVTVKKGDTLAYSIEFYNQSEKNRFIHSFKEFMNTYPFSAVSVDSTYNLITVRVLQNESLPQRDSISTVQRGVFFEDDIEGVQSSTHNQLGGPFSDGHNSFSSWDTVQPVTGGILRLYSPRSTFDQALTSLVLTGEECAISDTGICSFIDTNQLKITIRLKDKVVNARKRTITALDLIQQWTSFVKENPAQGRAIFSGVQGLSDFINGKEALIRGFNATDQRTVQLRFDSPQQHAVERLNTPLLLVPKLYMGQYFEEVGPTETVLLPNTESSTLRKAYLDKIVLKTGGDPNPVLSFSLNKFDALLLTSLNDINYVRSTLSTKADLHKVMSERYFISCRIPDQQLRSILRSIVNPESLLKNYLKVEGDVIKAVGTDSLDIQLPLSAGSKGFGALKILFRKDDQVSKSIAEKLLADCSVKGISASLDGRDPSGYERGLVAGEYNCAVGWVSGSILSSNNERLKLAAMWFDNEINEQQRIVDLKEIPLFSVNTYLCCRKNVRLYRNELRGVYLQKE